MLPEKYKTWSKIVLDMEKSDRIMDWWKQQDIETVENIPFHKGVITCKNAIQSGDKTYDIHLSFELKPEFIRLEEIYGYRGQVMNRWELLYEGSVIDGVRNFNITYDHQYFLAKQRMLDLSILFMGIVNFIVLYKEDGGVINSKSQSILNPKKKKKKPSKNIVYVPSKVYTVNHVPNDTEERKKRERLTEAWEVRGHPRHYKNGKVIWIKPFIKGDKSKVQPKEYKVTEIKESDSLHD